MPFPSPKTFPGADVYPGRDLPPREEAQRAVAVSIPHFSLPFRISRNAAMVVEQDTTDDVLACVLAILLCPHGYRAELPDFGIDDPTFTQDQPDRNAIAAAVAAWEPRADVVMTGAHDPLDDLISYVSLRLGTRSTD